MPISRWMAAGVVALSMSAPAAAEPVYMPLQLDRQWHYVTPQGEQDVETVYGLIQLQVADVSILTLAVSHTPGGPQDGLTQFYSTLEDGTVLFHGFSRPNVGLSVLYYPPMRLVLPPLAPGAVWVDNVTAYDMFSNDVIATLAVNWEVAEVGNVTVPAGEYLAYGIGFQALPALSASGAAHAVRTSVAGWDVAQQHYTLTGERLEPGVLAPVDWWAEGVGRVQYQADALYQLVGTGVTGTRRTTWGSVKQGPR